jgi:hypothetical protein
MKSAGLIGNRQTMNITVVATKGALAQADAPQACGTVPELETSSNTGARVVIAGTGSNVGLGSVLANDV